MTEIEVNTNNREELVDITVLVEEKIKIKNGILHLFIPHATAGLTINENADPNLPIDISDFLNKIVQKRVWRHDKIDNNADSHIKASLIGNSLSIPVKEGRMQLGTWQDIFVCEFDGPRKRRVILNFIEC